MRCSFGLFDKMIKKFFLLVSVLLLLAGCAGFSSKQEPAPVYGKVDSGNRSASKKKSSSGDPGAASTKVKVIQEPVILQQQELAVKSHSQAQSSNVVVALLSDADMSYKQGDLDKSVATIERALRIQPRNPLLLYKLALIRLQQKQPELAENLAKKSELLAEGNAQLKKKNWLLIAQAREQQNDQKGANAARKKAQQF